MMDEAPLGCRHAAATARNREHILCVLQEILPQTGTVLEIASGTGEHALYFAARLPGVIWQPSDAADVARESIAAWRATKSLPNLRPPLALDARFDDWGIAEADAVVCINMIHIAPWACCVGLISGAARILPAGGIFYLYGPYKENGRHTAASNAAFDDHLRAVDATWGVRDVGDVRRTAEEQGFAWVKSVSMPANNLSLIFSRS